MKDRIDVTFALQSGFLFIDTARNVDRQHEFKVDHNLLGMDFVRLSRVRWRGVLPERTAATELAPPEV